MAPDCKAFLHILKEHADPYVQAVMQGFPQYAYRQGTSTYDPILRASAHCHKVRSILELHRGDLTSKLLHQNEAELKGGLMCSLDLSKAFDMIDHEVLHKSLLATNMPRNLASLLVEMHARTVLTIQHGGKTECVAMSRGLRQGCPLAPMLYSAWVCHFCQELDNLIDPQFTSTHVSIFADDKHLFWEIHSRQHMQKAIQQLRNVISVLVKRGMQVSFQKSAVVYAMRGRLAEEMVGLHTGWHKGARCFKLRIGSQMLHLPIHDRLTYLGVVLSYGAFEMQTVQHRIAKASKSFGMLSKTLRVNGVLSICQRLRVYRACIWTSLAYGVTAVGFTAGSLKQILSTVYVQLRKVLRMHEKGTTQKQVLSAANLDVASILTAQAETQVHSTQRRCSEANDACGAECVELERAKQVLCQIQTLSNQESQGTLHAVVADQMPRVDCPVCGLQFAGDYGLQMHVKASHPELNQVSNTDFIRSKHSLFGAPVCRFCRSRCYNWQALEKHIAEGGCSRIKDAFAKGLTVGDLLERVEQEEIADPPLPPSDQLSHEPPFIETGHVVLTCAAHQVPLHLDAFTKLRTKCGLCGQRVRDTITLKTHWRQSHPKAWGETYRDAASSAKAMSSIFRSPCQFCDVHNKNAKAHAERCPTFFQVTALRKLQQAGSNRLEMEGVKQQRPRQHEREPEYKQWTAEKTAIGKAFGATSKQARQAAGEITIQAPGPCGQQTAIRQQQSQEAEKSKQTHSGLLRYFSNIQRTRTSAEPGLPEREDRNLPLTCKVRFRNPHSLCYANASVLAILHLLHVIGQDFGNLEFLRQACSASVTADTDMSLTTNLMFRSLLPGWSYTNVQRDAAEYTMLLLEAIRMFRCDWVLCDADNVGAALERGGNPLMMQLPDDMCTLQTVIDEWGRPEPGRIRYVQQQPGVILIQLNRYTAGHKLFSEVSFEEPVRVQQMDDDSNIVHRSFNVVSALFHTGRTIHSGHYQALLKVGASWYISDDNVSARGFAINTHVRQNVYLLLLSRC